MMQSSVLTCTSSSQVAFDSIYTAEHICGKLKSPGQPAGSEADDDEAFARRLQEQEDAMASRGRATRGALRGTVKAPAQKGPAARAGPSVRSSSRLKPQASQPKQRPSTRATAGQSLVFDASPAFYKSQCAQHLRHLVKTSSKH